MMKSIEISCNKDYTESYDILINRSTGIPNWKLYKVSEERAQKIFNIVERKNTWDVYIHRGNIYLMADYGTSKESHG